jgi:hypothetical protein
MLPTGRKEETVFRFYEAVGFSRHGKQAFIANAEAWGERSTETK